MIVTRLAIRPFLRQHPPPPPQINGAVLHGPRAKHGTPNARPIEGGELRNVTRLQRESPTTLSVFVSERGAPFTTAGFARIIERAAAGAELETQAHPQMLRHAVGYALANKGHDTRAIQRCLAHSPISAVKRDNYCTAITVLHS
jgi:integrase